jgi:hypothetical protein
VLALLFKSGTKSRRSSPVCARDTRCVFARFECSNLPCLVWYDRSTALTASSLFKTLVVLVNNVAAGMSATALLPSSQG